MKHYDWKNVEAKTSGGDFDRPDPGAYIARIVSVEDVEDKEYLAIQWDFADGEYKGDNQATFDRLGFWPILLVRSYKESALGFFKAFINHLEASNPGFTFDDHNLAALRRKLIGVVIGEEGYQKKNGKHGTRLYVAATKSIQDIQTGNYRIPEYREYRAKGEATHINSAAAATSGVSSFTELDDEEEGLPF